MSTPIATSHAGSLPRPDELIGDAGRDLSDDELAAAVADVVARQQRIGIELVNDGRDRARELQRAP
jgi:methionine synthase II (cobalamin-independent)